jgi:uncharacterized RDD family membrane protein YckC
MALPESSTFVVRGDDGEEYGPVELAELRDWVRENRAGLGTNVRRDEAGASWRPWHAYPELVALLAEAQATGAVAAPAMVVAPFIRRGAAFLLDLFLILLLLCPIMRVVQAFNPPDAVAQVTAALQSGSYVIPPSALHYYVMISMLFYVGLFLYLTGFNWAHGQTPAKALLRLRVVDRHGGKPGLGAAAGRSLIICGCLMFVFLPALFLFIFFQPQRRALHDLAAGTCVIEA